MKIIVKTVWENRSGKNISWFHPKVTATASGKLLMTLQSIEGSDYYLPVHESLSDDGGETWSSPQPIPEMGRKEAIDGIIEGICDVVPEYHEPTRTVLTIGHNVYYRAGRLYDTFGDWSGREDRWKLQRYPIYAVRDASGQWNTTRQKLEIPEFKSNSCYTCGCSQKVMDGDRIYLPLTVGTWGRKDRICTVYLCRYDGTVITPETRGGTLELPVGRGLMEPQLCRHEGRFLMSLRTEDGHGYYAELDDQLGFGGMKPWAFDDGEVLTMTNTQQHWLQLKSGLYLIYNRKLPYNQHLMRWRSPLLIAQVDPVKMVLIRDSEQVVFPMMPEDTDAKFQAALYGNFHPYRLSDREALITAGEERSHAEYKSNTVMARITDE